jgi:hypothetical protein
MVTEIEDGYLDDNLRLPGACRNQGIADRIATFEIEPRSAADIAEWFTRQHLGARSRFYRSVAHRSSPRRSPRELVLRSKQMIHI